jgi:probable HAF family extracellular repeat protein
MITSSSDLGSLGGNVSTAFAINNSGQVVGRSYTGSGGTQHAFRTIANGTITAASDLGTLGGRDSGAYGVNASGQVVGYSNLAGDAVQHAFRTAANGKITPSSDMGSLGGTFSEAFGINDSGQVVGDSSLPGDVSRHAFRTSANGNISASTDLGTLGGNTSYALGINASGQAVGASLTAGSAAETHAFFADVSGPMVDLNDLIQPNSGWVLEEADAINSSGQIAGFGLLGGARHTFLLSPNASTAVPLPTSLTAAWLTLGLVPLVRVLLSQES